MLKVRIPNVCKKEQMYALDILLDEFLGLVFSVETYEGNVIEITKNLEQDNSSKLTLGADFFHKAHDHWLKPMSMPSLPLKIWTPLEHWVRKKLIIQNIPILFGSPGLIKDEKNIHINLDIFGSAFFILSGYEELISDERDSHDRFPSIKSVAFKENFLNRPLLDEYLEILWICLNNLWPNLRRKKHKYKNLISCDVDEPYDCSVETILNLTRACFGDLIKRKSIKEFFKRINRYIFNKMGIYKFDRNYTFDKYMSICEKAGFKATFYFIPTSKEAQNGCYEVTDKKITNLLKKIDARGHEIGVHGSYQTYNDKKKMIKQKLMFENILKKIGINQKIKGNRQHFLRSNIAFTPNYLDEAGFEYDSSGSYADNPGFRYGTSKKFSMWGWLNRKKLNIKQQPLILMEVSITSNLYMGLGYSQKALTVMKDLKKKCKLFKGTFSLLWHNSELQNENCENFFKEIIND